MIQLKGYKHDYEKNFFKDKKFDKPKKTRINTISRSRKEDNKLYETAKRKWRKDRQSIDGFICQATIYPDGDRCKNRADRNPHHTKGRVGKLLYDPAFWLAICSKCHRTIHEHPKWAYDKGFLIKRL